MTSQTTCTRCSTAVEEPRYKMCAKCRRANTASMARYRAKKPGDAAAYLREWNRRRRIEVLQHYGGKCACCGEDTFEFLCIDHVNGGGEKHRAEVGQGSRMAAWIISNGFPDGFRVLCHNCNQSRGYYGYCPHERALRVVGDE